MTKVCIKCGYERRELEFAADSECPKCGVIYARAELQAMLQSEPAEFWETPPGQARQARAVGRSVFQLTLVINQTTGHSSMFGTATEKGGFTDTASVIESIEAEGWQLVNVGYVFRPLGSASRERIIGRTENEAISGEVIGIHLFRSVPVASGS